MSRPLAALLRECKRRLGEDRFVARVALTFALFAVVASLWDLPSSFGWENDGIAPRDLFGGLANNLKPGRAHRYPLLHYVVVGVGALPALLIALLSGSDFSGPAVQSRILSVPCMTAVSLVAKLVTVAMAAGVMVTVARIARRTGSERAGRFTALWLAVTLSFSYYARTSNLDVPYLFWSALALDRLLDLDERPSTREYVLFGLLLAAAVATKDQAYAGFVLTAPLYLVLPVLRAQAVERSARLRGIAWCSAASAGAYGVLSGALLNPTGFVARLGLLTGPNSQDYREYRPGLEGMLENARDLALSQASHAWTWPVLVLAWGGLAMALLRGGAARLLPLVYLVSHLAFFTLVVGRAQHRFTLPVFVALSIYAGQASVALQDAARSDVTRRLASLLLYGLVAWNGLRVTLLALVGFRDARREVEAFAGTLPPGTRVETYGLTVYQPRLDRFPRLAVSRVDPNTSPRSRNPIAGVSELRAPYGALSQRRPDYVIVPEYFGERFVVAGAAGGKIVSRERARARSDRDAARYFAAIEEDRVPGYRTVLATGPAIPPWLASIVPHRVHGSLGGRYRVLRRIE